MKAIAAGILAAALAAAAAAAQAPAASTNGMAFVDVTAASGFGLDGQGWPDESPPYGRLPSRAEASVREAVWKLSRNSAGLMVRFWTDADRIAIRLGVAGPREMPHMPATGVSGVDLYARDSDGLLRWVGCPVYWTGDACTVDRLAPDVRYHKKGQEYWMYLPLYATVTNLALGVPTNFSLRPMGPRPGRPVVVYGTSIAQGACASRPGMAWSSQAGRMLDRTVVNLGFSGNGRLEPELIALIAELDASLFVLDGLPNLLNEEPGEIARRVEESVRSLRAARPATPILLAGHPGMADGAARPFRAQQVDAANLAQQAAFDKLVAEGVKELHLLKKEDLGLMADDEGTVDGHHPNDLGMRRQAEAHAKAWRAILGEPEGDRLTTRAVTQAREPQSYDWEARFLEFLELAAARRPRAVLLGDSILHFWGGLPSSGRERGEDSWAAAMDPAGVLNGACGWERVENALWRVRHGALDGCDPELVVLLIGTNNLQRDGDEDILAGLRQLVADVRLRKPAARVLLLGLLPRAGMEARVANLNAAIAKLAPECGAACADVGGIFLDYAGHVIRDLMPDGLHPNAEGYRRLAAQLNPLVRTKKENAP
jgi:lysophospholipase L1-like esterase